MLVHIDNEIIARFNELRETLKNHIESGDMDKANVADRLLNELAVNAISRDLDKIENQMRDRG